MGPRSEIAREERGDPEPPIPAVGEVGEIGRTPIPVAESTRHPWEKSLPSAREHGEGEPGRAGGTITPPQSQGEAVGETQGGYEGREPEWALPQPLDPRCPPKAETGGEGATTRGTQRQDGGADEQKYLTPRQQLLEADKRRKRRLAALARDHILKLREERDRLAHEWSGEYAQRASSAKRSGAGLSTLRAEYVHRYDRLLEREKQPHSDFFVNLSEDFEDELDFSEDTPADLSPYDQYFEWDEAEYMRLRFTAARHYASRGHWTDAYAYVLRTRPDNIPQHEETYNRNAQAWHYTNARINELIQEAERILETRDNQMPRRIQFGPPRDSLIPPVHSTEALSSVRGVQREEQEPRELPKTTFTKRVGGQGERAAFKSPHLQTRSLREKSETQLLMLLNRLLGPKQKSRGKGE